MKIPRKTGILLAGNALMLLFCGWAYSFKALELSPPEFPVALASGAPQRLASTSAPPSMSISMPQRSLFFLPQEKENSKPVIEDEDDLEVLRKITIRGIIIDSPSKMAIVQMNGRTQKLQEGEKVGEWIVETITRKEILFIKNSHRFSLPLDKPTNVAPKAIP